jgi:hypothetical protein
VRLGLDSGRGGDGMRSAWNDCALDAPNFLQISGTGLRVVFSGLEKSGALVSLPGSGGRSFLVRIERELGSARAFLGTNLCSPP